MRVLLLLVFFSFTFAQQIDAYRMGYTDGYEQGRREGLFEGYRLALEDFKKLYAEKLKEYEEIEAGRLLMKEGRISYPRVYITGSGRVVVEGCRLINPVDDLLAKLPMRDTTFQREAMELELDSRPVKPLVRVVVKEGQISPESLQRAGAPVYRKEGDRFVIYFDSQEKASEFCSRTKCELK